MRRSQIALALGAIGLSLAAAGCGSGSSGSTARPSAHTTAAAATATVTPGPRATAPGATAPGATAPEVTAQGGTAQGSTATPASGQRSSPAPVLAGVVADCTSAPPHGLSVRPDDIALACADNGSGVEDMTWISWKATSAAGHGMFWDKLCQPSCAAGQTGSYPVTVALSVVKTSADGPWFSRLAVTWDGSRPPGTVPVSYGLLGPGT